MPKKDVFMIGEDEEASDIPFEYLSKYQALAFGFMTKQTMLVRCENRKTGEKEYTICICHDRADGSGTTVRALAKIEKDLEIILRPPNEFREGGGAGFN